MKSPIYPAFLVMITVICFPGAEPAQAQSIFLEPNNIGSVHLEALRPGFGGENLSNPPLPCFFPDAFRRGKIFRSGGKFPT